MCLRRGGGAQPTTCSLSRLRERSTPLLSIVAAAPRAHVSSGSGRTSRVQSLAVVENIASALWPENAHAAVAVPDGRKGEQVVLVTDANGADRIELAGWARNHGVSELTVPRRVLVVDAIPLLATGKTDYVTVQKMAQADAL